MYGDLSITGLKPLLDQLNNQTGILAVRAEQGQRYRIGLHQGTVQTLHLDAVLLTQRRQVVAAFATLLQVQQGQFAFTPCTLADLGTETTPMNLERVLESAQQEVAQPSAVQATHHRMPCAQTTFVQTAQPAPCRLPADLQDHWAALCLLLPVEGQGAGLNAQELAEQLGSTVGQMRVRLFRLLDAGLVSVVKVGVAGQITATKAPTVAVQPQIQPSQPAFTVPTAAASLPDQAYVVPPTWTPLPPEMLN